MLTIVEMFNMNTQTIGRRMLTSNNGGSNGF